MQYTNRPASHCHSAKNPKFFFTYWVFTPATFRPGLDALPTVFGIGRDALVPLWIENKEWREKKKGRFRGSMSAAQPLQSKQHVKPLVFTHQLKWNILWLGGNRRQGWNIPSFPLSCMLCAAGMHLLYVTMKNNYCAHTQGCTPTSLDIIDTAQRLL